MSAKENVDKKEASASDGSVFCIFYITDEIHWAYLTLNWLFRLSELEQS